VLGQREYVCDVRMAAAGFYCLLILRQNAFLC
jgi:hypothetical protein